MEKSTKGKRPSEAQKTFLVDLLELNLDLAHDRFTSVDGARAREKSWNNLATDLNGLGGANKDGSKWRKFWMDQKLYAKDRHAQLVAVQNKSGINGTKVPKPLTDIEERILSIMTPQAVDGDVGVAELGEQQQRIPQLNSTESQSTVIQYDSIEYLEETGNNFSTPTTSEIIDITILPHIDDQITQLPQPKKTTPRPPKKAKKNSADDQHLSKIIKIEEEKLEIKRQKLDLEHKKLNVLQNILQTLNEIKNKI